MSKTTSDYGLLSFILRALDRTPRGKARHQAAALKDRSPLMMPHSTPLTVGVEQASQPRPHTARPSLPEESETAAPQTAPARVSVP